MGKADYSIAYALELHLFWTINYFQVRMANVKSNKSATLYNTDSYVVSVTSK